MEHFNPFAPTEEQAKNNPNKFWEGYLGQKVELIAEKLKEKGNLNNPDVVTALNEAIAEVPKNKADFISKDELMIRALELYAKNNGGFSEEKLKKEYIEKLAPFLAYKLRGFDFEDVDQALQKEIITIEKENVFSKEDMAKLREEFGIRFSDLKMKEYAEDLEGNKNEGA